VNPAVFAVETMVALGAVKNSGEAISPLLLINFIV
jgi:hypothetical protein